MGELESTPGEAVRSRRPYVDRFLEPCLLLLVHCSEIHGYELASGVGPFGFQQRAVEPRTVYRVLRGMEDRGLVRSRWDTSNSGPARRVYRTTEDGGRYLARCVDDLRETDRALHGFLDAYDAHMAEHRS